MIKSSAFAATAIAYPPLLRGASSNLDATEVKIAEPVAAQI